MKLTLLDKALENQVTDRTKVCEVSHEISLRLPGKWVGEGERVGRDEGWGDFFIHTVSKGK